MKRITLSVLTFILAFFFCTKGHGQIITTFAGTGTLGYSGDGGPAITAQLNYPAGVAVDSIGFVYVADGNNNRIRRITPGGIINTVAGGGGSFGDGGPATAAELNQPMGVVVDGGGNLYVADHSNQCIRKINSAGIISTIAGTGVAGYGGDGGPATLAQLYNPTGVTIDDIDNIYVADTYNNRIRKITPSGTISTIAGTGVHGYSGDGVPATSSELYYPLGVAVDRGRNVYIADEENNRIRKVSPSGTISTIAGTGVAGYSGDGGSATAAQIFVPSGIAIDSSGNLFIADNNNQRIRKVATSGIITTIAGNGTLGESGDGSLATAAELWFPFGVAVARNGNVYLSEPYSNRVRKISSPSGPCSPTVSISVAPNDTLCPGIMAVFTSTVTGTGTIITYMWFENGTPVSASSTYSYFPATGDVIQCKIATSGAPCGTSDTASSNVIVMTVMPVTPVVGSLSINLCSGTPSVLSASPSGGIWSSGNIAIAIIGSSSGSVTGIAVGVAPITYTSTFGCSATTQVTVNSTIPRITGNRRVCQGDTLTLHNLAGGGVWTSDSPAVATINSSGLVTGLAAGTTVISYSFGSACVATDTVTIDPTPVITGYSNVCVGDTMRLTTNITGGTWQSSALGIATVSGGLVSGIATGTTIITYSNGTSCVAFHPLTVSVKPNAGTINGEDELCPGAVTTLSETIGGGTWSSGHTYVATVDSFTAKVTGIGTGSTVITYTVAPNGNGCSNQAIFTIVVSANLLSLGYNVKDPKCYNDNNGSIAVMVAGGKGPYLYSWSNGGTTAVINDLAPDTYVVNIKDSSTQCTLSGTFRLVAPDSPQVATEVMKDACSNSVGSIAVIVSGGTAPYHYQWSNSDTTNEISRLAAGDYTLALTDANGCVKNMSFTVADTVCADVTVHDGISPNGDGINDKWIVEGIDHFPSSTVQLFDKWGNMVFEKTNYNNDWNGGTLPDGTYYYLVKLNASGGYAGKKDFTGTLLIKR